MSRYFGYFFLLNEQGTVRAAQVPVHPAAGSQGGSQQRTDPVQRISHLSQGRRLPGSQFSQGLLLYLCNIK